MEKIMVAIALALISVSMFMVHEKRTKPLKDVAPFDVAKLEHVQVTSSEQTALKSLSMKQIAELVPLLQDARVSKKVIPNVSAFTTDAYILCEGKSFGKAYKVEFDYARDIIGITDGQSSMTQYIVREEELFAYIEQLTPDK